MPEPIQKVELAGWHIPGLLKRLFPKPVITGLREFKLTGSLLSPNFPPDRDFGQSVEDGLASAAVSVVVPIHDAPMVTRRCLTSLRKYAPGSEIILVDDASTLQETAELIRDFGSLDGWTVFHHAKPVGHSEACRTGANLATRPYLCLLNSDTVVTPWCWRRMKEVFEVDQKIAVLGPSTSISGNPQTLSIPRDVRHDWNDNQICAFANHLLTRCRKPLITDIAWVSGFAFFIRRSLWEELGGFDRKLPDYGNEVELCQRIAQKGYRLVWVRNCYIHHFGGQSYKETIGEQGILDRTKAAEIYVAAASPSAER